MNKFEMIIDTRELSIKEYFQKLEKPNILIKQMDIGDIEFRYNDNLVLLIERKTVADLSCSIKDGRHREQKARMLEYGKDKIMYLIEGNLDKRKISCLPKSTLLGSILNTIIRDNIKVYKTDHIDETIQFLEIIYTKLLKNPEKIIVSNDTKEKSNYISNIKLKKKENLTPQNCNILQLAQIPGCSVTIANRVIEEYKSIYNLCLKYKSLTECNLKENLLADLKFKIQNNKERRIGNVVSKRIFEYINN